MMMVVMTAEEVEMIRLSGQAAEQEPQANPDNQ
jgi:hypothetical protein